MCSSFSEIHSKIEEMLSRRMFGILTQTNDCYDSDTLILNPSDDEFTSEGCSEIRIPLVPKPDSCLEDPRDQQIVRPLSLSVLHKWPNANCKSSNTIGKGSVRAILDKTRELQSKLIAVRVESDLLKEFVVDISMQVKFLLETAHHVKGKQAAFISSVFSQTAVVCLSIIVHKLDSSRILDSALAVAQDAMGLLRVLIKNRNGCGAEEFQCAARNVAWYLAAQIEQAAPEHASEIVIQLLRWKRHLVQTSRAWQIVQCALSHRLLENMLDLRDTDCIAPVLIPWYRVMDTLSIVNAASLWISKFSLLQLEQCPLLLSRNLDVLRLVLRINPHWPHPTKRKLLHNKWR